MKEDIIEKKLKAILPDRPGNLALSPEGPSNRAREMAESIKVKQDLKEIARIKYAEKQKLKKEENRLATIKREAEKAGIDPETISSSQTAHQAKVLAEQQQRLQAIEAIEEQAVEVFDVKNVADRPGASHKIVSEALKLQGASRPEMAKLLTSLNINLSVQLTKQDTANLLACLLTCNETQLTALYNNKKIPIAIKTIIKKLQEDLKDGNITTIEKLWDRVFGKGPMQVDLPEQQQLQAGILPNTPVSREAYVIIRDTLIQ